MPNHCLAVLQLCGTRVGRLAADGTPLSGSSDLIIIDDLVTLSIAMQIEEGQEVTEKSACDAVCLQYASCDVIKRVTVELDECSFNPYFQEMVGNGILVQTGVGDSERVGFGIDSLNNTICPNGVSLEGWTRRVDSGGAQDPDWPWLRVVVPRVTLKPGTWNFASNARKQNPFTGKGTENPNWGYGPAGDWPIGFEALTTRALFAVEDDTLPTASCGYALAGS